MKKKLLLTVLLIGPMLISASVAVSSQASTRSSSVNSEANKTLDVAVADLPQYLGDPFQDVTQPALEVTSSFFDPLTRVNQNGATPWLAIKWTKVSPTAWNFTLRKGVKFSDGETFNSQAVVAAVNGLHLPSEKSAGASLFLGQVASATAISPYVVQITTTSSDAILPQQVAALNPVPPAYFARVGITGFATAPIGTGPYAVQSISTSQVVLKANYSSWRKPTIGHIVMTEIADPTARLNATLSGQDQVDLEVNTNQISTLKASHFVIDDTPNEGVFALQFVTNATSPLVNRAVRQALNYGVNRALILKELYKGRGSLASQGVDPGAVGYDPAVKPYPYDPTKAKKLLAAAGYPSGFSFTAEAPVGTIPNDAQVYQVMQSELAQIGVNMTVVPINGTTFIVSLLSGHWNSQAFGTEYQSAPEQDATKAYTTYSCLRNPTAYCDPVAGTYLDDALVNRSGRTADLNKLAVEENKNPAAIWLFNLTFVQANAKNVTGFSENSLDDVAWENVAFS